MGDPARTSADEVHLALAMALGPAELERIARRAAEIVEVRAMTRDAERPYLSVRETADYLRCSRQRVYDLLSQVALGPSPVTHCLAARAAANRAMVPGLPCRFCGVRARDQRTGRILEPSAVRPGVVVVVVTAYEGFCPEATDDSASRRAV